MALLLVEPRAVLAHNQTTHGSVGPMTNEGPQNIGSRLRVAREQAGLTLRQIADATKLSVRQLDALECERLTLLPGGIYRRAIVRAYSREVGLNPEVMLREFLSQYPDELPAPPPIPSPQAALYDPWPEEKPLSAPPRPLHAVLSIVGALIPIIAGILYFTIGLGGDAPRDVADVMPPRAADVWQPELVPAAGFSEARPLGRPVSVLITVSSRCELQVVADGREVIARRLEAGELVQLDLSRDIVMSGDNAGAVHFSINGRAGRQLGAAGTRLDVRIGRDDYDSFLVPPN